MRVVTCLRVGSRPGPNVQRPPHPRVTSELRVVNSSSTARSSILKSRSSTLDPPYPREPQTSSTIRCPDVRIADLRLRGLQASQCGAFRGRASSRTHLYQRSRVDRREQHTSSVLHEWGCLDSSVDARGE